MSLPINSIALPANLGPQWRELIESWRVRGCVKRLWARDASLWTDVRGGDNESRWMDWLDVIDRQLAAVGELEQFRHEIESAGFERILLLGMGGSSLAPEVLSKVLDLPNLHILDSTDPAQVRSFEAKGDLARTLFFVSSKSGSTLEPEILRAYFFTRASEALGRPAGENFVAVTDPGSQLEATARADGYRRIFYGEPSIGGRFSALSSFGMAPAAAAGVDVREFLERAKVMAEAAKNDDPEVNPAVSLGLCIGLLGALVRDKLTVIADDRMKPLGAWLEQLVAESTGKAHRAIIPVDLEDVAEPAQYGGDRLFVVLQGGEEAPFAAGVAALEAAGHPVIKIHCAEPMSLGQEFFRWEIATSVAGSVLRINPFNQPDVQASKDKTKELTSAYEREGRLTPEAPFFSGEGIELFADESNVERLRTAVGGEVSLAACLRAHIESAGPGDYFALLAYIEMNEAHQSRLQSMRHDIRRGTGCATCLGFGPRFLHSTGQAYKGGPNTGVFLQITRADAEDVAVPGKTYSFGVVKAAQARGDFDVLAERNRRALRVHLTGDLESGLAKLAEAVAAACGKRP